MILVDSNIPMYLVGADHPHKNDAQRLVERCLLDGQRLVTDAEVLLEILHRYVAIRRRDAIQPTLEVLLEVTDEVLPITAEAVLRAREIVLAHDRLSARDAVHLAVMEAHGIDRVLSFDRGFDGYPGVTRIA